MNQTTKYGLFFLGGVVLGALGAVESVREDFADAVAEAQVKSQEKKAKAEEAAAETREASVQQAAA